MRRTMHSAPDNQLLPQHVDAVKLCQQGGQLVGQIPLARLERLGQQLLSTEGVAEVAWHFSLDEQARKVIHGQVHAVLAMTCQRCLQRVDIPVCSESALALVWSDEQAGQLPRTLDPVLLSAEMLDLPEIVEEELLLSLPIVATHTEGSCVVAMPAAENVLVDVVPDSKPNPFQVLANLKSGRDETNT